MINLQPDASARKVRQSLVVILGAKSIFYEALAYLFEREICEKCMIMEDASSLLREMKSTERHRVLLVDAIERDFEKALVELTSLDNWESLSFAVALFNMTNGHSVERKAFMKGVSGFFYRQDSLQVILKGLDALLHGEAWIPHRLLTEIALRRRPAGLSFDAHDRGLTKRELDVLVLIGTGASNEEIGEKLCISPHTVKTHIYNLFKKLQVPNRLQAALWAEKNL
jgi:LuxR family transcriptional regulator, positive regulator of biofilm formation